MSKMDSSGINNLVERLVAEADLTSVAIPPDFDELAYLKNNPDVNAAVQNGDFSSGFHHYISNGRIEGRHRYTRVK